MLTTTSIQTVLTFATLSIVAVWSLKKGRQPHLDYLCSADRKYNVLPWDCTGYLTCSTDGREWFAHWMNCPDYLYWSQEKRTCSMDSSQCGDAREIARRVCKQHPSLTFPHPDSCSKYYDCSEAIPRYGLEVYENECPHPQLYDAKEEKCMDPDIVACGKRATPVSRCSYVLECGPCEEHPNGVRTLPGQPFSNYYLYCSNNKAYHPSKCANSDEVFDPYTLKCSSNYEGSIDTFCQEYPTATFPVAKHCAKYYNCSNERHHVNMKTYQSECPYGMLFDSVLGDCRPYKQVNCGDRYEPISPCEYTYGHCLVGPTCIPCDADCRRLPDGYHDYSGTATSTDYLECKDGRTVAIKYCTEGYILSQEHCVERAGKTVKSRQVQTNGTLLNLPWNGPIPQSVLGKTDESAESATGKDSVLDVGVAGRLSGFTSEEEDPATTTSTSTTTSTTEASTVTVTTEATTTTTTTTELTTTTLKPTTESTTTTTTTTPQPTTTQTTTLEPTTTEVTTRPTTETTTTELTTESTTQVPTTLRTTVTPTPCTTAPPPEPVIQYYCNCTEEVDTDMMTRMKALEDFVAEQKTLSALASLECKNPPTMARASTALRHTATGAEASYTCDEDYVYCGSRSVSVCPGNGKWQPLNGACVKSVWRYPSVMFREEFPCLFTVGTVITIHGTPTRYKKSMIHLMSGTDGALMITICFQCGTTRDKVTFSTELGGETQRRIQWNYFPFKVGKEFKIVISVIERSYKIDINDSPSFYYNHILPVPIIDSLVIADEITLRQVRIEPSNALQTYMPDKSVGILPVETIDVRVDSFIVFKAKSCGNVQFQLSTEDSASSQGYYIRLGEDSNTMTSIRKCKLCDSLKTIWHQPLRCTEFWPFWAQWEQGKITLGAGYIPGDNTFLEIEDSEYPINYFRTVQSSTTEWIFTTPITQCGPPPTMRDSRVYVRENGLVGEAVYTCDFMFTFCGQSHVSICGEGGKWEGLKGECLLSTWHWMPMPASLPFPCAFGLGSVFSVYGTPLRPKKFSLSLRSGADTLLIMTVGFKLDSMSRTMLYNAQFDHVWGDQEKDSNFPFVVRKEFHLTITVEKEYFKIAVDGITVHKFAHRGDYNTLNSAYINEDVMIRKIQVYPSETASVKCKAPHPIPNGQISVTDTSVGTEAKHTCVTDYLFCGGGDMVVCNSDGSWSGVEGECRLGSWRNVGLVPNTGYTKQFPCRYKPGFQISVQGKLLIDSGTGPLFSIRLRDGNDVIIGLDFHKTELKMNSKIPNWGNEESVPITKLNLNTAVDVAIMINNYEYIIYSGSKELYRYKHRTPVARSHEVLLLPNLDITLLQFTFEV